MSRSHSRKQSPVAQLPGQSGCTTSPTGPIPTGHRLPRLVVRRGPGRLPRPIAGERQELRDPVRRSEDECKVATGAVLDRVQLSFDNPILHAPRQPGPRIAQRQLPISSAAFGRMIKQTVCHPRRALETRLTRSIAIHEPTAFLGRTHKNLRSPQRRPAASRPR